MKRVFLIPALIGFMLMLGGCEFKTGDKLLQPPQPSKTYEALQNRINTITADGAIPVAPQSGKYRTTVQLVDLDLDGEDEAIAFFCEAKNPDQFRVYVFEKQDDDYVVRGVISGTGLHIASVSYPTLEPTGEKGIILSWKLGGDNASTRMTVCNFSSGKVNTLLETTYSSLITADLDADGTDDLVLFSTDDAGRRIAQMYRYTGTNLELAGEATLAPEVQTIVSLKTGRLRGDELAVLAEGKPELGTGLMTDILIFDKKGFRNLAFEGEDASEQGTYRPVSVPATDVNGDRFYEIPRAVAMPGGLTNDPVYMLDWYAYSATEKPMHVSTTYQNVSENWQFLLNNDWRSTVTVSKSASEGSTTTTFSEYRTGEPPIPLLIIYRFTGDMRTFYASREDMIPLTETKTEIFAASIPSDASKSALALTEQDILTRFSMITQSWSN